MGADTDFSEYNGMLRTGILEAFSGMIQGLGQAKADQYIRPLVPGIITFVASMGAEQEKDEVLAKAAVNLLGDVCSVFAVRLGTGDGKGPTLGSYLKHSVLKWASAKHSVL